MLLTHYQPLSLFGQLQDNVNNLLEGNDAENRQLGNSRTVTRHWSPSVDIKETKGQYLLAVDLPGIAAEDIDITMDEGILILKGERKQESEEELDGFHRRERICGRFYRQFSLPETADVSLVEAKSSNGVLEIVIPKQEKVQPQKITVQS